MKGGLARRDDDALVWRVEMACHAAWPTTAEWEIDGWRIRAAGGSTWRLNSISPLPDGPRDPAPLLSHTLPPNGEGRGMTVRVPAIATGLDTALDGLGFGPPLKRTLTLLCGSLAWAAGGDVTLTPDPTAKWVAARISLAGLDCDSAQQLRDTVELKPWPRRFAAVEQAGEVVAVGYAALVGDLVVLEAIATAAAHRRRGHGRALVSALVHWGAEMGAAAACLQVQADNAPALALYRELGFDRELYPYHYRVLPDAVGGR